MPRPSLNVMRVSWENLPDVFEKTNGTLVVRVMGTRGADDISVDLPEATCPPHMRWMIEAGVVVAIIGGPGADRITSTIGTVLDISYYGGNAETGFELPPIIGEQRSDAANLIQAGIGASKVVGGNAPDIIDLHGIFKPGMARTNVVLHTEQDRLFVPSDEGFEVDTFRFFSMSTKTGYGKLRDVDLTFHASNPALDGYEITLTPTQRHDSETVDNVWLLLDRNDDGRIRSWEKEAAVTEWIDDLMKPGGDHDQMIFG